MRKLRLSVLACFALLALVGAMQLSGCANPQDQSQSLHEGHGPGYQS